MSARIDALRIAPGAFQAQMAVETYARNSGIERPLVELVKLRASQMNGCAYCIDMHWKDLRAAGETEQRLYGLTAWRETPYYTERERAALAWAEAVTDITDGFVADAVYDQARSQFGERELVDLTMAVVAINGWNRLAIAFRAEPGTYVPSPQQQHANP